MARLLLFRRKIASEISYVRHCRNLGREPVAPALIDALKRLEYRGL